LRSRTTLISSDPQFFPRDSGYHKESVYRLKRENTGQGPHTPHVDTPQDQRSQPNARPNTGTGETSPSHAQRPHLHLFTPSNSGGHPPPGHQNTEHLDSYSPSSQLSRLQIVPNGSPVHQASQSGHVDGSSTPGEETPIAPNQPPVGVPMRSDTVVGPGFYNPKSHQTIVHPPLPAGIPPAYYYTNSPTEISPSHHFFVRSESKQH